MDGERKALVPRRPLLPSHVKWAHQLGGPEMWLKRIANGEMMEDIALSIGLSRLAVSSVLTSPEYKEKLREARKLAAAALAEQALRIADMDGRTMPKIRTRMWLASKWDQATYGEKAAAPVNIDLRQTHLAALRMRQAKQIAEERGASVSQPEPEPPGPDQSSGS